MISRIFDHGGLRDRNPDADSEGRGQTEGQHVGDERDQLRVVRRHLETDAESYHEFVTSNSCKKMFNCENIFHNISGLSENNIS